MDDSGRHPDFHRDGVYCHLVQQHHGYAPACFLVCERAFVRDLPAGYVLEAHDRARCFYRAGERNGCRCSASRVDAASHGSSRYSRRLDCNCAYVSERNGAELLDGHLGVFHKLYSDCGGEPDDEAASRAGTGWTGVFADSEAGGAPYGVVCTSKGNCGWIAGAAGGAESDLPVMMFVLWHLFGMPGIRFVS